jgi:hypothetical protein
VCLQLTCGREVRVWKNRAESPMHRPTTADVLLRLWQVWLKCVDSVREAGRDDVETCSSVVRRCFRRARLGLITFKIQEALQRTGSTVRAKASELCITIEHAISKQAAA